MIMDIIAVICCEHGRKIHLVGMSTLDYMIYSALFDVISKVLIGGADKPTIQNIEHRYTPLI